jgi:Flp pilus assembly pilin Flp
MVEYSVLIGLITVATIAHRRRSFGSWFVAGLCTTLQGAAC